MQGLKQEQKNRTETTEAEKRAALHQRKRMVCNTGT